MRTPPSLIKWTGSKRSQSAAIAAQFPEAERYIELFLGGGSILYHASQKYSRCIGNDVYRPLIDIWNSVKVNPEDVVETYSDNWSKLQNEFPDYYYLIRDSFNKTKNCNDLLFLSRTCTNGIIRFNQKGYFNNSLHVTRKGMKPDGFKKIVESWSNRIQHTEFTSHDFSFYKDQITSRDFIYLDPPYANSNNRYIENLDQEKLWSFLEHVNTVGAKWLMSFDGFRGDIDLTASVPKELFKRHKLLAAGNSAVKKVLSSSMEEVRESIYLNY